MARSPAPESRAASAPTTSVSAHRLLLQRLRRTNLDLLPILDELLRTRSVTASARALGISQPAVSKALRQLRQIFDDDLVVSLGRAPRLTDRAQALTAPLSRIMDDLGLLLEPARAFDPTVEPLVITINTADYVSVLLAPKLARICATEAPHVTIRFAERAIAGAEGLDAVDFSIVPRPFAETLGKRIERLALWTDEMVCIAAARDDRWGDTVPAEAFRAARHAVYGPLEPIRPEIAALIQPTSVLEIAPVCAAPNFLVLGAIVEEAACLALVPRRLALELARAWDVRLLAIDYPNRRLDIDACWTQRAAAKRGHAWAQGLLARAAAEIRG